MRIVTLIEDANGHPQCCSEHGFSVYVETGKHIMIIPAVCWIIRGLPNVHFLWGDYRIDEEISLFSDIKGRRFYPQRLSSRSSPGGFLSDRKVGGLSYKIKNGTL